MAAIGLFPIAGEVLPDCVFTATGALDPDPASGRDESDDKEGAASQPKSANPCQVKFWQSDVSSVVILRLGLAHYAPAAILRPNVRSYPEPTVRTPPTRRPAEQSAPAARGSASPPPSTSSRLAPGKRSASIGNRDAGGRAVDGETSTALPLERSRVRYVRCDDANLVIPVVEAGYVERGSMGCWIVRKEVIPVPRGFARGATMRSRRVESVTWQRKQRDWNREIRLHRAVGWIEEIQGHSVFVRDDLAGASIKDLIADFVDARVRLAVGLDAVSFGAKVDGRNVVRNHGVELPHDKRRYKA